MSINFKIIESANITEYQNELSNIEKSITYPLNGGADSFSINHGERYPQFFSDMGEARFILAFNGKKLCGSIAGIWKRIKINKKSICGLYIGDLKTISRYRGLKIPLKMVYHALLKYIFNPKYRGWDFLYYIGMNSQKGNVTKTFKGFHLGKFSKSICNQKIYIINSNNLNKLSHYNFRLQNGMIIDLSPNNLNKIITNEGKKNLTLQSSGEIMRLAHIHFQIDENINKTLSQFSKKIMNQFPDYKICFAVDEKNRDFIDFLNQNNIKSDTTCSVYTFNWPIIGYNLRNSKFISLSTAEI